MNDSEARRAICRAGAHLAARGLSPGTSGNISVCLDDGGWLVTPTNSALGSLEAASLSLIAGGAHASGAPPTKERFLHAAMYDASREHRAVVHLHSTYAVAYSCLPGLDPDDALFPITPYTVMRLGRVALLPYVRPGDPLLGELAREAARTHHAILLANHGPVVVAQSLDAATAAIEELEESAKLYFILRGQEARILNAAQVEELRSVFAS
jgi:ribulose-5-phosphate 4-epimerase/fuculose-1-phosphate aldolase